MQHRLLALGFRIEPDELEGTFGASTEIAVREFQRARGLPPDGILGPDTWGQLVEAGYRLGDRTLYLRSPAFRGDDVRDLQRMLNVLGFDAGKEDGIFGTRTDRGVREFQRNVASRADGIVGLDTVHGIARYRPSVDGPSRAVVREQEAARGPGLALHDSIIALDPDRIDADVDDASLEIALALAEELRRLGVRPLLLRNGYQTSAVDPARRANDHRAAAVISLALGSGEQVQRGTACFYYGTPTTHSPMGLRLAECIQAQVVRELGLQDSGIHPRSIAILRETQMPAVRIEPAVAMDEADTARIAEPGSAREVARAVIAGLLAFSRPATEDLARTR